MPLEIKIPFPGFYCSILSDAFDSEVTSWAEYFPERERDDGIPQELRLGDTVSEWAWEYVDYSTAYDLLARDYLSAFDTVAADRLGFELRLKWSGMTSPKYYNFETDRLFATITKASARKLFAMSKRDGHNALRKVLADRHTSRSGFISFYSSDLSEWLAKPVTDWDCNELASLLIACLDIGGRMEREDMSDSVFNEMDSQPFYDAFDKAMNWESLDARIAEERAKLEQEAREKDPDYIPPVPRCPYTLDLFASIGRA